MISTKIHVLYLAYTFETRMISFRYAKREFLFGLCAINWILLTLSVLFDENPKYWVNKLFCCWRGSKTIEISLIFCLFVSWFLQSISFPGSVSNEFRWDSGHLETFSTFLYCKIFLKRFIFGNSPILQRDPQRGVKKPRCSVYRIDSNRPSSYYS